MRRVRATFLLRCVIFASCVAPLVAGLYVGMGPAWMVGALAIVAVLPLAIELVLVGFAARSRRAFSSVWFIDIDQRRMQAMRSFHDDTSDNPTIR